MKLRGYESEDVSEVAELFYDTVHTVCAADYTPEQLDAWAPAHPDLAAWNASLQANHAIVAEENGMIVGFGDMTKAGYLDRLYVRAEYRGHGVASAICDELESHCTCDIETHSSLTARGFFEKRGYIVIREQTVTRRGVPLTNFVMKKTIHL